MNPRARAGVILCMNTCPDPFYVTPPLNLGDMGVVTLGPEGKFVSRRPLAGAELVQAWTEHFARHGIA